MAKKKKEIEFQKKKKELDNLPYDWVRDAFNHYYGGYPVERYKSQLDSFRESIMKFLPTNHKDD